MIIRFLAICAALLLSTTARADLVQSTSSYGPFNDAQYVEDRQSNIVMTMQREAWRNGFGVDFRGLPDPDGIFRAEYFCEPDAVLLIGEPGRDARAHYLGYLAWTDDLWVSDHRAIFTTRHVPSLGSVAGLMPRAPRITPLDLDITVSHVLDEGAGYVVTTIDITNTQHTARRLTYIYQDSAYMWFPDGDQRNVESVRISVSGNNEQILFNQISSGRTPADNWQFVGTFNREHGVIAGLLSTDPTDIAGIHYDYVGVEDSGDGLFVPRSRALVPQGEHSSHRDVSNATFVNRFIALDFGVMESGETKRRFYTGIMTVLPSERRTDDGIRDWVVSMVRRVQTAR